MPELAPYLSPADREAEFADLVNTGGGELVTYGHSVEGRDLVAGRFPGRGTSDDPVMVCANIHGIEYIGNVLAHQIAQAWVDDDERVVGIKSRADLWVVPCINPDGYARTWERDGVGRTRDLRWNHHGVDLNRNFPMPYEATPSVMPGSGSLKEGAATYRGRAPLSEPETTALLPFLDEIQPRVSLSFHSFAGVVITPRILHDEDDAAYATLADAFVAGQQQWHYRRLANRTVDVFTGELEDYQHHVQRCWAACVELFPWWASVRQHLRAPSAFWRFNPRDPMVHVENDLGGVAAFLSAGLDLPRPPEREGAARLRTAWSSDG